jgi:hypothetical protein
MTTLLIAVLLLLIAATVIQVVVPRIGESRIERRLAEGGGDAFVVVEAMPATKLLNRSGDRLMVRGRRLEIGMSREGGGLSSLDGFREVDIVLHEFRTGPFEISHFELSRDGQGPYLMRSHATTSGAALAQFGGNRLGGLLPALGAVAGRAPLVERAIAVSVEVELASEEGVLAVVSGGGTVAGYPAGPVAPMIAAAVARRLEITY